MNEFPHSLDNLTKQIQQVSHFPYQWDGCNFSVKTKFRDLYRDFRKDLEGAKADETNYWRSSLESSITKVLTIENPYRTLFSNASTIDWMDFSVDLTELGYDARFQYSRCIGTYGDEFVGYCHPESKNPPANVLQLIHEENAETAWSITTNALRDLLSEIEKEPLLNPGSENISNSSQSVTGLKQPLITPTVTVQSKLTEENWKQLLRLKIPEIRKNANIQLFTFDQLRDDDLPLKLVQACTGEQNGVSLKVTDGLSFYFYYLITRLEELELIDSAKSLVECLNVIVRGEKTTNFDSLRNAPIRKSLNVNSLTKGKTLLKIPKIATDDLFKGKIAGKFAEQMEAFEAQIRKLVG